MEFEEIYNKWYTAIYSFVRKRVKTKEEAEEITHDTFIRIHDYPHDENKGRVENLLMHVARNIIIDKWRTRKLKTTSIEENMLNIGTDSIESFWIVSDTISCKDKDPLEQVVSSQTLKVVLKAIVTLPIKYRTIAKLYLVKELKYKEIEIELGIPMGTVKAHIHRVKELLQKKLQQFA